MAEQPVSLFISDAGKEQYRNSVQQGGQESYDAILQRREQLKNEKISLVDYSYEISRRADTGESVLSTTGRADGYVKGFASADCEGAEAALNDRAGYGWACERTPAEREKEREFYGIYFNRHRGGEDSSPYQMPPLR